MIGERAEIVKKRLSQGPATARQIALDTGLTLAIVHRVGQMLVQTREIYMSRGSWRLGNECMDPIAPGAVTPQQMRALWTSVMVRAAEDLRGSDRRERELTKQWIAERGTDVGGYLWVCDAIDISPDLMESQC